MQTVERAMGILMAFKEGDRVLGVSEIARSLELPKSAVHRILGSLIKTGFVEKDPSSGRYRLGPRAIDLGMVAIGTPDVRAMALPIMQELGRKTEETVTLSMLVGRERIYVSQVEGPQTIRMTVKVGARFPLYAGASGRAILAVLSQPEREAYLDTIVLKPLTPDTITSRTRLEAEIKRVRTLGYAASAGERDPWAAAVAAPLVTTRGRVLGSMSVCGPKQRFGPEKFRDYGQAVVEAASTLSHQIG